jgi:signal transduction histidine kinase/ActR/RegA family two-component response regulator
MGEHHSILIIDDTNSLLTLLTTKLSTEGYEVHSQRSIHDAFEYLKQHEAPTFVLADRMLDEPIEVRDLGKLCEAAPTSKVLVYTAQELTEEQHYAIRNKGAYRVLDKKAVKHLVENIKLLTQEFDELLELSNELQAATAERSKIMAALIGTEVAVSVVDRHLYRWFPKSPLEQSESDVCRAECRTASFAQTNGQPKCWGCPVLDVFDSRAAVDGLFLNRFPNGSVGWVAVQSTPILARDGNTIIAASEAVTAVSEPALAGLPLDKRLHHIAASLIRAGFGRARIYKSQGKTKAKLLAAAARTDSARSHKSEYFESFHDLVLDIDDCPYATAASLNRIGVLVETWDEKGPSPLERKLQLELPYFDVPVWRDEQKLDGWISVDFVGMDDTLREWAISHYARPETLTWLQAEYGREVKLAIEATEGKSEHREKLEIAQRARFGIAGARSVDEATKHIRDALRDMLPNCRVSVRICTDKELREFDSLCWGSLDVGSPPNISLSDPKSLAASVVKSQLPIWLPNYGEYAHVAESRGNPVGYLPSGVRSTAQIPLRFENAVFGTLSVNSLEPIEWKEEGYKEPLLALAKDIALVLRDLALHEKLDNAMADRAAIVAYSVSVSADALWRHWAQQRLAEASALVASAQLLLTAKRTPESEKADQLLTRVRSAITRVHTARPVTDSPRECSVAAVFSRLQESYAHRQPRPAFENSGDQILRIPAFILRNILMVLLDNAMRAIEDSGRGTAITVTARAENSFLKIDVSDDGPGIPAAERELILREPLQSQKGQGLGLLYARGAALQYGGDLAFKSSPDLTRFTLRLPLE